MKLLALPSVAALVMAALVSCNQRRQVEQNAAVSFGRPAASSSFLPPPKGDVADNSRCHVCHINYADEEIAIVHAKANIGCEKCHGSSNAHCSDENNITAPDIMYPVERINEFCLSCHLVEGLGDVCKSVLAGTAEKKTCTDCHGEHRLGYRTQHWDKSTGKLLKN